jgi:molybdopterin molybdotransferase
MTLSFEQARACVVREVLAARKTPAVEQVSPLHAAGKVLAEEITADRDYPPFARSARDGFAIRAADVPGDLQVIGEVRAGEVYNGAVGMGQAVEIMTGAPLPDGADAVVMVEHTEREGNRVRVGRASGAIPDPQFERLVDGRASGKGRGRSAHPPHRPRQL